MKEPEIKLFGRKIVLPENDGAVANGECSGESTSGSGDGCLESSGGGGEADDGNQLHAQAQQEQEECETRMRQNPDAAEGPPNPTASLAMVENPETPAADEDLAPENDASKTATLKKPDKIIPCPRCNSMDTKFCYYNNYNVNQPRHFCKSCQRYWTAGGTMRNVPVGAGRRKNKNSVSHCRHISISEVLQAARVDASNGFLHPPFGPNNRNDGTVLSFGSDSPLCESMASAMNLSERRTPNGYPLKGESKDDCSSTTITSSSEGGQNGPQQQAMMPNLNGVPYPIPCIPGVAWPIPWNPAMPLPAMCPPGYPVPVYPAPYWNCGAWNVHAPWVSPAPSPATNEKAKTSGSAPNSPLGKHSRNGELLNVERSILVPKTLRIDDPEEAAKSSIWETLGIKYDSFGREGLFKALQPKGDAKKLMVPASPAMQANPAALSRSINFQEGA